MRLLDARRPATALTVNRPPKNVLSATTTNNPIDTLLDRQAQRICEFVPISIIVARLVAELHYAACPGSHPGMGMAICLVRSSPQLPASCRMIPCP
jgi:hypothetical protein